MNRQNWQPLIYSIVLALGVFIGILMKPGNRNMSGDGGANKFSEILSLIDHMYVDTVNFSDLEDKTINQMLNHLDPHSLYIPAAELKAVNEPLEGNFEGIGIEFNIVDDTIMVVSPINGGPSQQLGILSGDRIVKVNGENVSSIEITTEQVMKLLKGPRGTEVKVSVYRRGLPRLIEYTIVRNTIPIHSVDASYKLDRETGYIKISRFAANTHREFTEALAKLQEQQINRLVIDLRGNPGGYLNAATEIADELLDDDKLIVYTQGRSQPRNNYKASKKGLFEQGRLVVLVDEGSASASEILSGAVQDWDRGIIIGRRSFGKGLVQEPFELRDGSALRLTVSRYYTPSGRCIQKPYSDDIDDYEHEIIDRFSKVDTTVADSAAGETYKTGTGRIVYGGGGIMPDIVVMPDTGIRSGLLTKVLSEGLISRFVIDYFDKNREQMKQYLSPEEFDKTFDSRRECWKQFLDFLQKSGLELKKEDMAASGAWMELNLRALLARQLWKDNGYYYLLNKQDKTVRKAQEAFGRYEALLAPR